MSQQQQPSDREHAQGRDQAPDQVGVTGHEEHMRVDKDWRQRVIRASKRVETEHVEEYFPREVEQADAERMDAGPDDSGEIETLPDGSLSIPILEEQLVVTKRVVTRERLIIRKHGQTELARVEADLKREVVDVEGDAEGAGG